MDKPDSDLLVLTSELVGIASVSEDERQIADYVESQLGQDDFYEVVRVGNNLILTPQGFDPVTGLLIAGHLDTVPPSEGLTHRMEGDHVYGLGAVDMKGGVAIMISLARSKVLASNTRFVFYASEEISRSRSGLLEIEAADPKLLLGACAILMEPTGGVVEAGCQGTAKYRATIVGERAHTARPWMGSNAIHNAAGFLDFFRSVVLSEFEIDGCLYREALSAVRIQGGIAGNVVPDRVIIDVNYRFAPGRDDQAVVNAMQSLLRSKLPSLDGGDSIEILEWAPSAPPNLSNSIISALVRESDSLVRAKLGWTDVAYFWERNVPACNFGPGDPTLAHTNREVVTRGELVNVEATLVRALGTL